ncbi:MAG: hypothetical protein ACJA2S_003320 [Cyclobacteriaceae bacterium]|jgi:hypothetical protein
MSKINERHKRPRIKKVGSPLKPNNKKLFWKTDINGKVKINQHKLIKFLEQGGFCKIPNKNGISDVRVVNNVVIDAPDHEMIDFIKEYLIINNHLDVLETFSTGVNSYINKGKLKLLKTVDIPIDKDSMDSSWFYYQNMAVKVTKEKIEQVQYANLPHKIWDSRILKRDYMPADGTQSDFYTFLFNLAGQNNERFVALLSIMGYLLQRFQNKSVTKAVILVDENMSFDGQANGGSGKTLITEALGKMRELVGMDGKSMKTDSWFKNQRIEKTTSIVRYDDVQRNFSLEILYSMITSGITVERKHKDEFYIAPEDAPKIVISSNYPVKGTGGSTDIRRRCEYEVANYYNADHQPIDDFKKHFFDDWNEEEWGQFDSLMIYCVQIFLQKGLIIPDPINLVKNKLVNDTCPEFVEYLEGSIEIDECIDKREYHKLFIEKYPIHKHVTSHQFTKWLKEFAGHKELVYEDKSAGGKYSFILKTIKKG